MAKGCLYFGYGSNLNAGDWRRWCEERGDGDLADRLRHVGPATLPDRRLGFTRHSSVRGGGVLDVVPARGHVVEGEVFEADEAVQDLLDAKEGAPWAYRRIPVTVFRDDGQAVEAFTYEVPPDRRLRHVDPAPGYLDIVLDGYENHGIPVTTLRAAAAGKAAESAVQAFFVYGTLMRGESRFPAIHRHRICGALLADAPGRLVSLGSWPGLVEGEGCVHGELLRVANVTGAVEDLDFIEGFRGFGANGSLFVRILIDVHVGDGRIRRCWSYRYAGSDGGEPIAGGDWRRHRGVRAAFFESLVRAYVGTGDEREVARRILNRGPFPAEGDVDRIIDHLLPLAGALGRGAISERDLVLATRRKGVVPRPADA